MPFKPEEIEILKALTARDTELVRRLLAEHPEFLHRDFGMGTVLHMAARDGDDAMAKMLLELGCDPNAEVGNSSRDTPLFCALVADSVPAVRVLLENGADPNKDRPIITAVVGFKNNSLEFVKLLEQHGADLHREYPFAGGAKVTALGMAATYGKRDVVEFLQSKGCR